MTAPGVTDGRSPLSDRPVRVRGPADTASAGEPASSGSPRRRPSFRQAVAGLTDAQLDTPYRDGGWTVRQVVHHVPDSHLNAYTRFRLALTEPTPTIQPYIEHRWAELPDARGAPVEISLSLLEALHRRWVLLLRESLGRPTGS